MNSREIWNQLVGKLSGEPSEFATTPTINKQPLWFTAKYDAGIIYIDSASIKQPSSSLQARYKAREN
ncbi:hypothetical protein [Hymenobacter sp. BT491]|uniref:hypothetical protein n=1 Tax=Hymenobacter sp. BT491 TaxID=2766779 RepID=UPI0016539FF4|nr:hypothetical protein [Hymenobacter sp. BT491]MBC6988520.1 hypothetical protein [Hymenobacter sp. BT491]